MGNFDLLKIQKSEFFNHLSKMFSVQNLLFCRLHATLSTLEAESGLSETKLPSELTKVFFI